ncbi:hypothetical protein L209DRAFT_433138 [Thermothelomyces heterothallicus CBS 203.75]
MDGPTARSPLGHHGSIASTAQWNLEWNLDSPSCSIARSPAVALWLARAKGDRGHAASGIAFAGGVNALTKERMATGLSPLPHQGSIRVEIPSTVRWRQACDVPGFDASPSTTEAPNTCQLQG